MPNITINNASFYYELHGAGQPLILIAGYGANGRSWMPIVEALSRHFLVMIFDNRAGGQTTDDGVTLSVELMGHRMSSHYPRHLILKSLILLEDQWAEPLYKALL